MALLGNLTAVRKMLRADPAWDMGVDTDDRLTLLQGAVTAAIEERCGRTFGSPVADTSRLMWTRGDTLLLDRPARIITSVRTGGTVVGSTMTGGTLTLAADLVNRIVSDDGLVYAISPSSAWAPSGWWGWSYANDTYPYADSYPVYVTGDFSDTDDDAVIPDDVSYVASYLIGEVLKKENASPAGFLGPEGVVPIRDVWKDPMVLGVIQKYSVRKMVAV